MSTAVPSWSAQRTHDEYVVHRKEYKRVLREISMHISATLSDAGIKPYMIEARDKEPLSLFAKQGKPAKGSERPTRYENPWEECSDLLGIRIIVQLASEKWPIATAFESSSQFKVLDIDDKEESREVKALTYAGLHLDLLCKWAETPLSKRVRCEVQIRTLAEHTWAETEHEFIYKGPEEIPKKTQRQFARVLALVELLDLELDRGVKSVSELPSYATLRLSKALVEEAKELGWTHGSRSLSLQNLDEICARTNRPASALAELARNFASGGRLKLADLQAKIGPKSPRFEVKLHALAAQPECILVAALIEENPLQVRNQFETSDLYDQVRSIARALKRGRYFA
jgi:ppGpp synthetase/RelA/SpoT-type nucleotidyltranferase